LTTLPGHLKTSPDPGAGSIAFDSALHRDILLFCGRGTTLSGNSESDAGELQHLKQVSRIKHQILTAYLRPWATILGATHRRLRYFDCFAGPGKYESGGKEVLGSPAIAVEAGKEFLAKNPTQQLEITLTDDDPKQVARLKRALAELEPYPAGLTVEPLLADSNDSILNFLRRSRSSLPSFFVIDPYGHPLPVPVINQILGQERSEVFINLMWWRINMDIANPVVQPRLDTLFGDREWRSQEFVKESGDIRRDHFLAYFLSRLSARFTLPFTILYDAVEDRVRGERVKYYLIHGSNSGKAALLMKDIMYKLGDEQGTFGYSGTPQAMLISETPPEEELVDELLRRFAGQEIAFDDIRENTYRLPFIEKHYRSVLQQLRKNGKVQVTPVTSKTDRGLSGRDLVCFLGK
jgi:three-Cys-motif partner protein